MTILSSLLAFVSPRAEVAGPPLDLNNKTQLRADVLSGLTVALALVPEAVAFAFVCGVPPLVGLYAAFIISLITSVFGGRPGMISGATGAVAVVVASLVKSHGIEYLFATVILAGAFQVLAGLARLGKFIRLVPEAVMFGFVNGLAIVIFLAQGASFKNTTVTAGGNVVSSWMSGSELTIMLAMVALAMAVIWSLPKLTKAFPAPLAGILVVSAVVLGLGLNTKSVGDLASIAGGLPTFHFPSVPLNLETLKIILPYSAIFASVGLIESLMTLTLIDEMTESRGRGNRECLALGAANMLTGSFGGMGGCAMIGQSVINVNSGGRGRLSGLSASLFLLAFILFGSSLIEQIPIAALTGVMFMVVIGTFEWSSFRVMKRIPRADAFVIVLVSLVTVFTDLAIAVGVGVVASALVFAWERSQHIGTTTSIGENGTKVYHLDGPLFFASIPSFRDLFNPADDPDEVVVDFRRSRVYGHAGLDAIDRLAERYTKAGKRVRLVHLSSDCRVLLEKAGNLVEVDVIEDPHYHMAVNELRLSFTGQMKMVSERSTSSDYLDRLMRRESFAALWPLFAKATHPAKELTESFSALEHLRPTMKRLGRCRVLHIGDGAHARTAALFALKTDADNISIDPLINEPLVTRWRDDFQIQRFAWHKGSIESAYEELNALPDMPVLVTFVHAHVRVDEVLDHLRWDAAYTLACCSPASQLSTRREVQSGEDYSVLSPERRFQVLLREP